MTKEQLIDVLAVLTVDDLAEGYGWTDDQVANARAFELDHAAEIDNAMREFHYGGAPL